MTYENVRRGVFISRPNRFIAHVAIDDKIEICHVKNTGRCKELLIPGTAAFVQKSKNPKRSTKYDLITVYKGDRLVNIDSAAPNKVFAEWVQNSGMFKSITLLKPEYKYKNSRFDFYMETGSQKILVEVKGVTLEEDGVAMFPDAPTERGLKHVWELCASRKDGFDAYVGFIIQMRDVRYFTPNYATHKEFGYALQAARAQGVKIFALACDISENSINAGKFVNVRLNDQTIDKDNIMLSGRNNN